MKVRVISLCTGLVLSILVFMPTEFLVAGGGGIDVVINEIMYDPEGSEVDGEWVELYNNGSTPINIDNWTFTDQDGTGDDFIFPDIEFPPNKYILLHTGEGANDTDFSDGVAHFYLWKTSAIWSPDGDDVLLKNDTGIGIDYVAYGKEGFADPPPSELSWSGPNCSAYEGDSISLHPNGLDTDSGLSWEESDPTPGRANAHINDAPPIISWVSQTPLNPRSSESVTITSNVTDDWDLKSVILHYSINGTVHFSIPMGYDGTNFTAQIPTQVEGTVIEYYVNATDDAEQNTTSLQYAYAHSDSSIQMVINEFMARPFRDWNGDGYADSDDEWIELYNPGDTLVSIGGWKIDDSLGIGSSSPYTIPQGYVIQPKKFLLFFGNETGIVLNNYGDNVTLLSETNAIIDIYPYTTSKNDTAIGRFPDGSENWKDFLWPSPGEKNQYTVDTIENLSNIKINEFLPSPKTAYSTEWIELYNIGTTPVRLDGCWLDDAVEGGGSASQIPLNTTIHPGEFWVLYEGRGLNSGGDTVNLVYVDGSTIIDSFTYPHSKDDVAIGRFPDGTEDWKDFLLPTPGTENEYTVGTLTNLSNIKINEFMPSPKTSYSTEWIELYNRGTTPVSLDGCWLDDAMNSGKKPWQMPLKTTIQPGEVLFFNRSFGLNNGGDTVNLLYVDCSTVIDTYSYDSSEYDISFGRGADGEENWVSFSYPTPDQPNTPYHEPNSSESSIVISELFYKASDNYEFLCLCNPSSSVINISGWRICDGRYSYSGTIIFPEDTTISSLEHIYIAHNATLFYDIMSFYPDFEMEISLPPIPKMITRDTPSFANDRDEVLLLDSFGNLIDIVVYGDSEYEGLGWNGTPILDAKKGEILKRNFDMSNLSYEDTNTSLDWRHIRHYKLGQSNFEYEGFSYIGNMTLFASPDSSYETITNEIEGAKSTIYISLYQFTNWNITKKIIERLNDGVEVKILMEGGPVEGILEEQKYVLQKIFENGGEVRFIVSDPALSSRYRYTHAKYAIIDNTSVIISSENWKYSGIPVNNTYGNRGWGVVLRDENTAKYFADVFLADWSSVRYDIITFMPDDRYYGNASSDFEVDEWIETGYYAPVFPSNTLEGEFKVYPVLSPDSSLLDSEAILGMINSATQSIHIEQLDIALNWNDGELEYENLYLGAAIEAAQSRGVEVRILLSSAYAFPDDPGLDNYDTYLYINDYASHHNITEYLEARLVDYDRLGVSKVHNKGMIVDGNKTLISSINWNRNSVTQNREAGVIIESEDVAEYFTQIFLWDWNEPPIARAGKDITVRMQDAVQFSDLSKDSDDNIVSYFWDFDDSTNSTEQNPTHIFEEEGIYEVRLTVSDGQYSDSHTITVIVLESKAESGEMTVTISMILLVILIIIIVVIIAFIRRMRQLFL